MVLKASNVKTLYFILDINECIDKNGGCGQMCNNLDGGHECYCLTGFVLNGDGKSCNG